MEIMWIAFVKGYFTSLQDEWNISTKNNEHDLHRWSPQTCSCVYAVLRLIRYWFYWFMCTIVKSFLKRNIIIWHSNTYQKRFIVMSLWIVMPWYVHIAMWLPIVMSQWPMTLAIPLPTVVPQWGILSNIMIHCDVIMSHGT